MTTSGANSESPSTMKRTAPRPAPDDTPTRPGSASGLRNNPWRIAPDTARPAPMRLAIMVRGRRMSNTTTWSRCSTAWPTAMPRRSSSAPMTSVPVAPTNRLPNITRIVAIASIHNTVRARGPRSPATTLVCVTGDWATSSIASALEVGIELRNELLQRRGRPRPKTEQVAAVHVNQRLVLAGRRLRDGRIAEDRIGRRALVAGVVHHQDHVGLGGDHGFIVEHLVAREFAHGVASAREGARAVRRRAGAGRHALAALHGKT